MKVGSSIVKTCLDNHQDIAVGSLSVAMLQRKYQSADDNAAEGSWTLMYLQIRFGYVEHLRNGSYISFHRKLPI